MDNAQGGHELLHLQTNKVVKRRNLTKIPITPSIIKQVHALLQQPHEFQVPNETENEHKIVFEEANNAEELQEKEELSEDDDDEEYEPGNDEDISLEADGDDVEEEDDQGKRRTGRVRVPP
jgi:hypothetical protein